MASDAWSALALTFLTFNALFMLARFTSRFIEEKLGQCYAAAVATTTIELEKEPINTTEAISTDTRTHVVSAREMVATYLTHLESDERSVTDTERVFYRAYEQRVSLGWRVRQDKHALPLWLEYVLALYNNPLVFHSILLGLCLLVLIVSWPVFSLFHSLPPPPATTTTTTLPSVPATVSEEHNASEVRRLAIAHMSGEEELYHCAERWRGHTETCYAEDGDLTLQPRQDDVALNRATLNATHRLGEHQRGTSPVVLTDRNLAHYFAAYQLGSGSGGGEERLFAHQDLQTRLEQLRLEEIRRGQDGTGPCICPIFLGLVTNLTLLYQPTAAAVAGGIEESGASWLLMHRPVIVRNNSFAQQVVSSLRYHFNSNFFTVSQRLAQLFGGALVDLVHYDSFVVEYSVPETSDATLVRLSELGTRLRRLARRPVLLGATRQFARVKKQLSGNDAICYIYCDRVNTLLLHE